MLCSPPYALFYYYYYTYILLLYIFFINIFLQVSGFGLVTSENVFKVCDQPHPKRIKLCIDKIREGNTKEAQDIIIELCANGYAASDVIQTIFRVTKAYDMPEHQKLEYIREIGFSHLRISEGLNTQLQLLGCISRMCKMVHNKTFQPVKVTSSNTNNLMSMDI